VFLFVFSLAKLRRWSSDIWEGAKDYHYIQQEGWKGRRGKRNSTELGTIDDKQLQVDENYKQKIIARSVSEKKWKKLF